jgi:transcription initiation factor IIE alpha subunit
MSDELKGKRLVLAALARGGKYSPIELATFCRMQINTVEKWIHHLRKEGHIIEKERRETVDGKHFYKYFLAGNIATIIDESKLPFEVKSLDAKIKELDEIAETYPIDHQEKAKICEQINQLKILKKVTQ